ncbi:Cnl2/NKP2 family domain-containing protein [Trichoderma sp. SZMC 28013]
MPPPSESDILTNYLLQPAPLPSITTFNQFVLLFPRPLHNSPQLRSLYRDLQAQRNAVVDAVAASIQDEVKRGVVMRREVLRLRKEAEREDIDGEVEMERALFGHESGLKSATHSLNSVIPELEGAVGALEADIKRLEEEEAALQESIQQTIGGLSDLRYGKLANGKLRDEIVDGLKSLQEACENKS